MPISATGTWINSDRLSGFTLLEVMVTVVLIGIIATFAVLSVRGSSSDAERLASEARRLATLIELNHQEAVLRGEQRGVHFTETGYSFLNHSGKEWVPLTDSSLLKEYRLPSGFKLALWVDDRREDFRDNPANTPHVLLLSSGEAIDFKVILSIENSNARGYSVSGDATGKLRYSPVP